MGKKKILIALLVILFIGFVALNVFMLSRFNFNLFDIIGNREFPQSYIAEKNGSYTRNYPDIIKGSWEPSASHMAVMLTRDINQIKELGLNTVSIVPAYVIHEDMTYSIRGDSEEMVISNIIRAKEAGFSVFLAPDLIMGNLFITQRMNITREEYFRISNEIAVYWAKIAEDFGVEYFCPQNEINIIITVNFAENDSDAAVLAQMWHMDVLDDVNDVFTGKTMVKLANGIEAGADFTGYDYIGVDFNHQLKGLEEYRQEVVQRYEQIAQVAQDSGADWLVAEAWFGYVANPPHVPEAINEDGESLDEMQDEYYQIAIEEYIDFEGQSPVGFMFHTWIMPGTDIRDRPAEGVVSAFFNRE